MLLQLLQLWPCDAGWHWHQHDQRYLWRGKCSKRYSLGSILRFSELQAPLKDLQKASVLYGEYLSSLKLTLHHTSCFVVLFEPSASTKTAARAWGFQETLKPLGFKTSRKNVFDPSQLIMLTKLPSVPRVEIKAVVYFGSLTANQVPIEILQHGRTAVGLKLDSSWTGTWRNTPLAILLLLLQFLKIRKRKIQSLKLNFDVKRTHRLNN